MLVVGPTAERGVGVGVGSVPPDWETCWPDPEFTSFMGIAKAIPETVLPLSVLSTLALTTPMASPNRLSSGPPLLTGFSDASVCRRSFRLAETIQTLTVGSRLSELPNGFRLLVGDTNKPTVGRLNNDH